MSCQHCVGCDVKCFVTWDSVQWECGNEYSASTEAGIFLTSLAMLPFQKGLCSK
jgi:hypothetical protein